MVWCNHCKKNVPGESHYDSGLACHLCGKILEKFNFSSEVTFIKNAAGQSQASGNVVTSVQSGNSISRDRRKRIGKDEIRNLKDALGIGDGREDVVDMASRFFDIALDHNFTKGHRTELVQSSCLYLTCRQMNNEKTALLLIDFSSYLRVSVYELGSVYLQLCEMLYLVDEWNYEGLVDPSIYIPRFVNSLLKGKAHDKVLKTARNIISSMKRDWMQTGRKPSGICGAAMYIAALSHGFTPSRADIAKTVHMCEATITKRLNEFANTEAASLTVDELEKSENILGKKTFTPRPSSDEGVVNCKHKDLERFGYGLCKSCHDDFITISGGVVGGSDPPAFQRAEKERMEKAENEGGIEKSEGKTDWDADASDDESGNLSELDGDAEVNGCFLSEEEKRLMKDLWELNNKDWVEEQTAKDAALKALNPGNAPEYARNLVEASKAAVAKSKKEKRQKRAEEAKNAPPPATALEAVRRTLERKKLSGVINLDVLAELFDTSASLLSSLLVSLVVVTFRSIQKKSRTETVTEKNKEETEEHEIIEEDEEAPYEMITDEKLYEDQREDDGYDFGLY